MVIGDSWVARSREWELGWDQALALPGSWSCPGEGETLGWAPETSQATMEAESKEPLCKQLRNHHAQLVSAFAWHDLSHMIIKRT